MISRFRRQDRSSKSSAGSREDKRESSEDEISGGSQQNLLLGPSNSTRARLSAFDLPLRYGHESKAKEKERSRDRRSDPLGLTVLHEPESSPSVDIVFVHGLGGTSRQTWSKNRDLHLFWPLEWLPYEPELSSARILTFGYNSQFSSLSQRKESIVNISDFAKDLLFSMKFATGEGERKLGLGSVPILFVAHSMGGLIVKKAFILGQHDEHYQELVEATSGIVFLSTPHRGSNLAEVLNKILSACVFAFSPKQYISELSLNSSTLQEINEQFRNLAPSLSIVSFFETLKTVIGPSQVMVCRKDSSILGYPGEITKPLDADHHDVCKYTSQQDPNYISVRNILKYLVEKYRLPNVPKVESNSVDELHEIASAFGRVDGPADDLLFFSDRRMPNSCEWTNDDSDLNSFLMDESLEPRCLWYTGRPGSGKSVLASSIIQTSQQSDINCAFYFFRFGDQVKNNLSTMLLSLAYQIAGFLPEYRRRLLRLFADGLNVPKSAPRLLWQKLFISTFSKLTLARSLLIIIDGLDECDSSGLFLKFLEDFHALGAMRILVLSRSTQSLSTAFEKLSKKIHVRHHSLQQVNQDLRKYVNEEMANMHGDDDFKDAIATELVRKADGNFLWATLVMTEVLQCHTEDAVFEALDSVPEELEPLYERMDSTLAKSCRPLDRAMGKTILLWIACSRHHLNLLDLAEALKPEYANILDLRYTISCVCGEFVIVDGKGVVSLVHSSARDCLFQNPHLNYHISRDSSHQLIFEKCITALIDASPSIQKGHMRSQAFLRYASTSWPFHLEQAAETSDQNSLLLLARFFENSAVLSWIYLLSVAGQLRVLVQASKKVSSFLKNINRLDEGRSPLTHRLREQELLLLWMRDLIRLVGKFGSHLNDQPKLIFKLVAPFCPQDSMLFKQFGSRNKSSTISLSGQSNRSWDDCLAKFAVHNAKAPLQIKCANRYFAILISDGTVLLYYASTCEDARQFHHGERVLTWCFSQIGDRLVTYGLTKTVVWDTATGQQLCSSANSRRFKAVTIAFADGYETLVICCDDRVIRRLSLGILDDGWQVLQNKLGQDSFEGKQCGSPRCASFNPSASQIAVTYRAIPLAVWSLDEPGPILIGRCQRVHGGRQLHGSGSDIQCITWNPMTGHILGIYNDGCVFKWHPFENDYDESSISAGKVECSPDGKFFVTSSRDGTFKIWDFDHFTPVYQLFYSASVVSFAIDPNDTRIYDIRGAFCSVWEPNALVRIWETDDRSSETMSTRESTQISQVSEAVFESLQPITALAVDFESSSYAVGGDDGLVTHFTKDGTIKSELIQTLMTVEHICWSDDGRYIAASGLENRIILKEVDQLRPSQMSKPIMTAKEEDPIRQILLSPTGTYILVTTDRFLNIWSTHEKQILSTRPQTTLHRWFNYPPDEKKVIGIDHAGIQIIDWQDSTSSRLLTLEQTPMDSTTNQRPSDWLFKRPSQLYPMSLNETEEVVDKTLLTVDGTISLTVISRRTPQGRRERQYMLINIANLHSSPTTEVKAMALPPELQANLVTPLGFLAADLSPGTSRRSSVQQSALSSPPETASSRPGEHLLAFLDHSFWVCTYLLSETRSGRVKRHFFLPRDWQNLDWLELAVMWPDGTLLCPRNGEVVLVENGLREEWLE